MSKPESKTLASYNLDVHGMRVEIKIEQSIAADFTPQYNVSFPGIGNATKLLLMSFRGELTSMVSIDPSASRTSAT
jgi:hypothetical protein